MTLIHIIRIFHTAIFFYLTFCVIYMLYCGVAGKISRFLYIAIASMVMEGIILAINHGHCPISMYTKAHGGKGIVVDTLFPMWFVPYVTPFYAVLSIIGIVLFAINLYRVRKK